MINPRRAVGVAALVVALAGAGACKYTGGDSAEDGEQTEAAAPKTAPQDDSQKSASADDQGDKAAPQQEERKGLGEGTDAQRRLMVRAKKAFLTDQTERAEQLFEQLADTGPVSGPQVSAIIALGQIYNETGRSEKALELYEGLAERVEDVPEVQLVVARAFAEQGKTKRAIRAYEKLLDAQPDYVFGLLELGELYGKAGKEEQAAKTFYKYEQKVYSMAKRLEDESTPVADRLHILDVFSLVPDDRAEQAVAKAVVAPEPPVRAKAATVLGETGVTGARETLEQLVVADPSGQVRMAAKDALKRLEKAGDTDPLGPDVVREEETAPAK